MRRKNEQAADGGEISRHMRGRNGGAKWVRRTRSLGTMFGNGGRGRGEGSRISFPTSRPIRGSDPGCLGLCKRRQDGPLCLQRRHTRTHTQFIHVGVAQADTWVFMHTHTCGCVSIYIHLFFLVVYIGKYTYSFLCTTQIQKHTQARTHAHAHICVCVFIYMWVYVCV